MKKSDLVVGMDVVLNKLDDAMHYTVERFDGNAVILSSSLPIALTKSEYEFDVSLIEKPNKRQLEQHAEQQILYKNNSMGWMINENLTGRNTVDALDARDALFGLYQGEKTGFETWGAIGEDLESGELKGKILNSGLPKQSKEFILHAAEAVRQLITTPNVEAFANIVDSTDEELGIHVVVNIQNYKMAKADEISYELIALYSVSADKKTSLSPASAMATLGSDVRTGKIYDVIAGLSDFSKDFIHDAITPFRQMLNPEAYARAIAERIEDAAAIEKYENESGRGAELDKIIAEQGLTFDGPFNVRELNAEEKAQRLIDDAEYDKAVADALAEGRTSIRTEPYELTEEQKAKYGDEFNDVNYYGLTKEQAVKYEVELTLNRVLRLEALLNTYMNDASLFALGDAGVSMTTISGSKIHYNDNSGMLGAQIVHQDGSTIDFSGMAAIENFHLEAGLTNQELFSLVQFQQLGNRMVDKENDLIAARELGAVKQEAWLADVTEESMSEGRIFGITEHYVVQSLGRNAIIHAKSELSEIPELGKIARIDYKDGVGHVEVKNKNIGIER